MAFFIKSKGKYYAFNEENSTIILGEQNNFSNIGSVIKNTSASVINPLGSINKAAQSIPGVKRISNSSEKVGEKLYNATHKTGTINSMNSDILKQINNMNSEDFKGMHNDLNKELGKTTGNILNSGLHKAANEAKVAGGIGKSSTMAAIKSIANNNKINAIMK